MIDTTRGFTLVRTFEATPEEVWRAWADPDEAAQWWHPRETSTPRESVAVGRHRRRLPGGRAVREACVHLGPARRRSA